MDMWEFLFRVSQICRLGFCSCSCVPSTFLTALLLRSLAACSFWCVFCWTLAPCWFQKFQNCKCSKKLEIWRHPLKRYCFLAAFWKDFGTLGNQFWLILGSPDVVFCISESHGIWRNMCPAVQVEGLTLMIGAARSRSTDQSFGW